MPEDYAKSDKGVRAEARRERLAAELRGNLAKRKAQTRARTATGAPADTGPSVASAHRDGGRSGRS